MFSQDVRYHRTIFRCVHGMLLRFAYYCVQRRMSPQKDVITTVTAPDAIAFAPFTVVLVGSDVRSTLRGRYSVAWFAGEGGFGVK